MRRDIVLSQECADRWRRGLCSIKRHHFAPDLRAVFETLPPIMSVVDVLRVLRDARPVFGPKRLLMAVSRRDRA